jgi:hypothetical protein
MVTEKLQNRRHLDQQATMIVENRRLHVLTPEPGKARSMSVMAIFHQLMGSFRVADKPTETIDHDLLGIFLWHFRKKSAGRIKARFTAAISGPQGPSDIGSGGIFCKARRRPEERRIVRRTTGARSRT